MKKLFHSSRIPALNYTQEELNILARNTILQRISVPGVQPKLSLHLEKGSSAHSRLTLVGLEGDYILKPQTPQWPFLPEAEHFCMLLARKCNITTVDFGLIPLKSGELAYITRRMDRTDSGSLHIEDFCQILNKMTDQKYNGSMEQIGKALRRFSDVAGLDAIRFFELALFSFITGNSDMHLKNFSLLYQANGRRELSPAYDLVPVSIILPEDKEEMALTLNGKKANLKRIDFERLGISLQLSAKQIDKAFLRLTEAVEKALPCTLQASFLPIDMQEDILLLINSRIARLRQ
ncbi:MAG: HipA domain-containing protein [Victivallales bacterium]|nr:HipA domain-containing protein [Victivallales bacterium]